MFSPHLIAHNFSLCFVGTCAGLILSACTIPDLKYPITEFSDATKNSEMALIALNEEVTTAYGELLKQRVLDSKSLVNFADGECLTSSERCRLILISQDGKTSFLKPDRALQNMIMLMGAIRAYAAGLAAIVEVDAAGKVETQVNAAVGNVQKLSTTVKDVGGKDETKAIDMSEYATPVGQFVNWFVGQYVAKIKLTGLKRATKNSKPVVAAAASLFGEAAHASSFVLKEKLAATIRDYKDALDNEQTEANLMMLIDSTTAYDQLLVAKPTGIFNSMVQAHNVLVDEIQGQNVSLAVVISRIEEFAAEAETLSKVLKAFSAVGKDQKTNKGN